MKCRIFALVTLLHLLPLAAQGQGARIDGTDLALQAVAQGLDQPVFLTAPAADPRLFVVQQTGKIVVLDGATGQVTTFADLSDQISTGGEQGLLGLAFHPAYARNGRFFTYMTDVAGDIEISEHRVSANPDRADPDSRRPVLNVPHPRASNHNGGWLGFGPDGYLYIGTGDGGGAGDRANNAQNRDQLLGKILRIDVDRGDPYGIPSANPFAHGGGAPEIFALGLRNPWRAAFDGDRLYIGDVGQDRWEEIDVITTADAGANLGWRMMEGAACFNPRACDPVGLTLPLHVYDHAMGCSIAGGPVYRGAAMPALRGRYFFSDFCSGLLMSLRPTGAQVVDVSVLDELGSLGQVTSFGVDAAGEIHVLTIDGAVSKLVPAD